MLDSKFKDMQDTARMQRLYTTLSDKLGFNLDDKIFNNLLDYIDIRKQHQIQCFADKEQFSESVYNGYTLLSNKNKFLIRRMNSIVIAGDVVVGYKQHSKYNPTEILKTQNGVVIAVSYLERKGYSRISDKAILERSNIISIYVEGWER